MKVYLDLIFLLNIVLDFILLISVSIVLSRNVSLKRLFLGSIGGGLSTFILFFNVSSFVLLIFKFILGILMCLITFSYKNIKYTLNNIFYLYINSFIIGGGLTLIKDYYYSYIILIIGFLVITCFYIKGLKKYHDNYSNYYNVFVYLNGNIYNFTGYLDTGNKLFDPYKNRPIILISKKIPYEIDDVIYVPYVSLNNKSVVKCLKVEKIVINNKTFKNYLVGLSDNKFHIDGVDCILHSKMKGNV